MEDLEKDIRSEVPELETLELVPLVRDQINDLSGVDKPVEVKMFGPDFNVLRELAGQVGKIVEKTPGLKEVNSHVQLGNPDIVVRHKSPRRPAWVSPSRTWKCSSTRPFTGRWPPPFPNRTG